MKIDTLKMKSLKEFRPEIGDCIIAYNGEKSKYTLNELHPDVNSKTLKVRILDTKNLDEGKPNIFETKAHWGNLNGKLVYVLALKSNDSDNDFSVTVWTEHLDEIGDISDEELKEVKVKFNLK